MWDPFFALSAPFLVVFVIVSKKRKGKVPSCFLSHIASTEKGLFQASEEDWLTTLDTISMIKVFWHETELGKGGLESKKPGRKKMPKVFQRPLLSDARKCFGGANYKSSSAARTATDLSAHESRRLTAQQQRSSFLALALVVLSSSWDRCLNGWFDCCEVWSPCKTEFARHRYLLSKDEASFHLCGRNFTQRSKR